MVQLRSVPVQDVVLRLVRHPVLQSSPLALEVVLRCVVVVHHATVALVGAVSGQDIDVTVLVVDRVQLIEVDLLHVERGQVER